MGRRLDELEQYAIEVILDKRHGFRAILLRIALRLLSFLYLAIVQARLYLYRKRVLKERQLVRPLRVETGILEQGHEILG